MTTSNLYATLAHSEYALGSYLAFQNACLPQPHAGRVAKVMDVKVTRLAGQGGARVP